MNTTRRAFLASLVAASARSVLGRSDNSSRDIRAELGFPRPELGDRGDSSVLAELRQGARIDIGRPVARGSIRLPFDIDRYGAALRDSYRDLPRHVVFEYYPWYGTNPYRHWDESDRTPPDDVASNYMPVLGAYDSRSKGVIERHARWMAQSGAGAINLSWWGRDSFEDRTVHVIMDIMRDHDLHVAFHLEPYANDRAARYASDIVYLLREYGEKRRWDSFLLLEHADGSVGPVFKSFRTIVPSKGTDCHGVTHPVPDYTTDDVWRRQTDVTRETVRKDFDRITLLADSLDFTRTRNGGFDGLAIYDNFVRPDSWRRHAVTCRQYDLLFSFNINPGFDAIVRRHVEPGSCYRPPRFEPGDGIDWSTDRGREDARLEAEARIEQSLQATIRLQTDPLSPDARRGFFLTYVNSFNEWHEGHQFEPAKNFRDLTQTERRFGYHNAVNGDYRLRHLQSLLTRLQGSNRAERSPAGASTPESESTPADSVA